MHKLPGEAGDGVSFDKVLLLSDNDKVTVGTPYLPHALVTGQIVSQLRGDKVLVFKKKRRKSYQKLNGHRQYFTQILIDEISESGEVVKSAKPAVQKVEKPAVPKSEKTVAPKKAVVKETEKKTPAKATAKKPAPAATKKPAVKKTESKAK